MRRLRAVLFWAFLLGCHEILLAQITTDVLGVHNLGAGPSPLQAPGALACTFCHAPHGGVGGNTPLWNQVLSTQNYTVYTSSTMQNKDNPQVLGESSSLCLSCHDGTVAVGQTAAYGKISMNSSCSGACAPNGMYTKDVLGTDHQGSHPFSLILPIKDAVDLVSSLATNHTTADTTHKVQLINGNVECNSCHNPHVQSIDPVAQNFLVLNNQSSAMCFACHDPNRIVSGQANPLANWSNGIHATATNQVAAQAGIGSYNTVAQNACLSCHQPHNAPGFPRLLRAPNPPLTGVDTVSQDCATCHNGGSNISPAAPDVFAEYTKKGKGSGAMMGTAHPWPDTTANAHDAAEPALLNGNRHAACVDCHNSHSAQQVSSFTAPPAIRVSQAGVAGISETDGVTVLNPAVNQYQNCLRCHGSSSGKQSSSTTYGYLPARAVATSDPLNIISQFNSSATSRHPVLTDALGVNQPSLLAKMLNEDGTTQGRAMGSRIFCTDCHNSDDNREFGGTGPNGPHGSQYYHLLERRYEMSQAPAPGQPITNLYQNPNLDAGGANPGPYALCAKCHNLSTSAGGVLSDATFKPSAGTGKGGHYTHVWDQGISCSVCHTAHGTGAPSSTISGGRLVNFDTNVVAPNAGTLSYNQSTNTCVLTCHNYNHNSNGTVTLVQ